MLGKITALSIVLFARLITAVRGIWDEDGPQSGPQIYFANHVSHGDFILIWTVLPPQLREKTRPVAGADYWLSSPLKTFIGQSVFNAVLIERDPQKRADDPVTQMAEALVDDTSLILFPEGTRNTTDTPLLPFKSGLYHLAKSKPDVPLVPVWIENLNRVLPKGEVLPVPLLCTVTFGDALTLADAEDKDAFLRRAEQALLSLRLEKEKKS